MSIYMDAGVKILFILFILQAISIWINSNNHLISDKKRKRDKRIICTISMILSGFLMVCNLNEFVECNINELNDKTIYMNEENT